MMMRSALLAIATTAVAAQEATTLVVTVGTQDGFFKSNPTNPSISGDIGPLKCALRGHLPISYSCGHLILPA